MMIKQVYVTNHLKKYFENDILKYSSLKKYNNNNEPSFIYGFINNDFPILNNNNIYVIIWTGGDCNLNKNISKKNISNIKKYRNVFHIAITNFIENSLKSAGLKYISYPFYIFNKERYQPVTKGNCIYVYCSVHDKEAYGYSKIKKLEKIFKNNKFIYCTNSIFYEKFKNDKTVLENFKCYSKDELVNVYKKCFIGLRLTNHDGLAATVQELGCMGIKTVWNGNTPSALNYKTFEDIVNHIKNEQKTIGIKDEILSNKVKDFFNIKNYIYNLDTYMTTVDTYFDNVYILNIDTYQYKWNKLEQKIIELGIKKYQRFSAINGYLEPHLSEWKKYSKEKFDVIEKSLGRKKIQSPGVLGNLKSLIEILKDAKKNNYKKILFLEDDVIFHKNFNILFNTKIKSVPKNWKVLYFGANDPYFLKRKIKNNYYADNRMHGGFAIGIDISIYDDLIAQALKKNNPFDSGPLRFIMRKYPKQCIILYPNLIICDVSRSDLRNKRDMKSFSKMVGWNLSLYDIRK